MRNLLIVGAIACVLPLAPLARAQSFDHASARAANAERTIDSSAAAESFRLDFGAMQDQPASLPEEPEDDWRVDVTGFLWLTAMTGDVRVGPRQVDIDASFSDVVDGSDSLFALSGRLEVGKGKWTGFIDGIWSEIGVDDQTGPLGVGAVDVVTEMVLVDFGVMYRVCDKPAANGGDRNHTVDLYLGGRYRSIDIEIDPALGASRSDSKSWLDPIIGARAILQISERFDFTVMGDIGGFGVGSDFTWSLRGLFGFHFEMFDTPATLFAGYAVLGTEYATDSGLARFEYDMLLHGPVLGLTLSF